ncbi:MAG: hypothetical protein HFJ97_05005 [Eubacterium sp.]|nr:hypothetical protein [Eubacterium sp.]
MKKFFIIIVSVIVLIVLFVSCSSDSSTSYNSNSNSGSYGYGSKYDKDVNDIADAYGKSADEVNDLMNAMGGAMK